jgi:O-antigen ligase
MTSTAKYKSKLRSWAAIPLVFFISLYCIGLSTSLLATEIAAWATFIFFVIFAMIDRSNENTMLEFYALGIEFPLLLLIFTVIFGLRLNAPNGDFIHTLGNLRNFGFLFALCYALQIYKNLNRLILMLVTLATLVGAYGLWQHFSGIDLIHPLKAALDTIVWNGEKYFAVTGFFKSNLAYGYTFAMLVCIPWAALLYAKRLSWWQVLIFSLSFAIILLSLLFTYAQGVWLSLLITLPIMAFFASRKFFFMTIAILAIVSGVMLKKDPEFKTKMMNVLTDSDSNLENRKKLWQANTDMFHAHPWIGVGYQQNELLSQEYFEKAGIKDGVPGHAHSNYIEFLSTTGIIGTAAYMLFILAFILMTSRLLSTIPTTHYWHRVFTLSALGAQIAFHVGGLTQCNFGIPEAQHLLFFWLAITAYMSQRYYAHIVPDDHSL